MAVDSDRIYGGGITVMKIGGAAGVDVGGTVGGVEVSRSMTDHFSEVDQLAAEVKGRPIMNAMHVRGSFAQAHLENIGYASNIEQAQIANSSVYMTDSDGDEVDLYFEGPGQEGTTFFFDATRAYATGDTGFTFARDADNALAFDYKLFMDTTVTPNRFALVWLN